MVLSSLLTLSVLELAVVILALAWASSTTMVSVLQLHTNADALSEWQGLVTRRRVSAGITEELENEMSGFINASMDAVHSRKRFLKRRTDAAATLKAKLVRDLQHPERLKPAAGQEGQRESAKDRWMREAKKRVMRAGCPKHRDVQARFSELLEQLSAKMEVSDTAAFRSQVGELDGHEAEMLELMEIAKKSEAAVEHMEAKAAEIAALWPRWFNEAKDDEPIYRGLFKPDAKVFPTHDLGLKEYLRRTGKPGG